MRRSSALGGVICAAAASICMLTAGQASATVLCAENKSPCGFVFTKGTTVKAALPTMTTTVIETEIAKVTCLENKIGMSTTANGGKSPITVPARVYEFSLAECTVPDGMGGTESCTVKPVNHGANEEEQWLAIYEKGIAGNGTFGIGASSLGTFGFSILCNQKVEKINCTFTNATSSTFTGGGGTGKPPATFTGAEKMNPAAGTKCPKAEATWKFTWAVSSPEPLFMEPE